MQPLLRSLPSIVVSDLMNARVPTIVIYGSGSRNHALTCKLRRGDKKANRKKKAHQRENQNPPMRDAGFPGVNVRHRQPRSYWDNISVATSNARANAPHESA
jgi:hypothetical protein